MRVISLMMFVVFFALGGFCDRQSGTPSGKEGDSTEKGPDKPPPPPSVSSPTDEGQKENVCQFKEDHVLSETDEGWFGDGQPITVSGSNLIVKGSDEPKTLMEIIDEGGVVGFGKDLSKKKFSPAEGGGVVLPYEYTGDDYEDWCPTSGEQCIVEVIYRGASEESIYKKENTHPRARRRQVTMYVFKGDLTIQVLFSGRVLDFSVCN